MNTVLLQPTDILFFRDGRPMTGASAGHGAAWPLPNVINHAFHAALHRAGDVFQDVHVHRSGRNGVYEEAPDRRFGSLVTAGPFPVCINEGESFWFFPRPADADDTSTTFLRPHRSGHSSSLPSPCKYPVVSFKPPSKETVKPWWNEDAWNSYLGSPQARKGSAQPLFKTDSDFADVEHTYGIGIGDDTGTVEEGQFYSANYLRLREGWKLGVLATAPDRQFKHSEYGNDLVRALLNGEGAEIIAGGQQRVCTATLEPHETGRLPLPLGLTDGFAQQEGKWLVKWILLTPALWPEMKGEGIEPHSGGWLPNWVSPETGRILLKSGDTSRKDGECRETWRERVRKLESIAAHLVAAIVPKPIPVTGWALPNHTDRQEGGAKCTNLAVPAGAVYYFEAEPDRDGGPGNAIALANALNWHGKLEREPATIKNRRSTLMGEKGFGLGVCGAWEFYDNSPKTQT